MLKFQQPEEVKIPVPWGHISGKWWGRKDVRPILALHGWQDNCGTFDTLAPLLPKHIGFLAIDLPGHGTSSRIPDGALYNNFDFVVLMRYVCKKYNWDKVSIVAHSLGAVLSFIYGGIYPNHVDMLIALDGFRPHTKPPEKVIDALRNDIETFMVADERNRKKTEPPSYTFDELIQRAHEGSRRSIGKETAHHIIARGVAKSEFNPDKYYFTRDARLKSNMPTAVTHEVAMELAKNIQFPYVAIEASKSQFADFKDKNNEFLELLKTNNSKFEHYMVQGTHHVHLNEPEKVIDIINNCINKYHPPGGPSVGKSKL